MITQELLKAKQLASARFLRHVPSVVGVGIGPKIVDNVESDITCIRVYVTKRFEFDDLSIRSMIPKEIMGQPTDVVELEKHGFSPVSNIVVDAHGPNLNPKLAGSAGAVLVAGEERYLLGANHVLSLNGRVPQADIYGPKGKIGETIPEWVVLLQHGQKNQADAALARLDKGVELDGTVNLTSTGDVAEPTLGTIVKKVGADNDQTGTIVDNRADFFIDYSFGTFQMENQIFVKVKGGDAKFAKGGDSGSVIVDRSNKVVGMVIASAGKFAAICPISAILEGLKTATPTGEAIPWLQQNPVQASPASY
jgi:hypothetical protein